MTTPQLTQKNSGATNGIVAFALAAATMHGLSPIPVGDRDWTFEGVGGTESLWKRPAKFTRNGPWPLKWKPFQARAMSETEVRQLFDGVKCMGLACGFAGLEAIDMDHPGAMEEWESILRADGHDDLLARLVVQTTATAGRFHVLYRCEEIEGNQHLARRYTTKEEQGVNPDETIKTKIETRGVGGYIVAYPTHGYRVVRGNFNAIPTITVSEREILLAAARMLDEVVEEQPRDVEGPRQSTAQASGRTTQRPGDDYNARASWRDILEPQGKFLFKHGDREYYRRPGKNQGISATTGNGYGKDLLKVHTSNWPPFKMGGVYDKFGATVLKDFGGDLEAAGKALYARGFGERGGRTASSAPQSGSTTQNPVSPEMEGPSTADAPSSVFTFLDIDEVLSMPDKPFIVEGLIGDLDRGMLFGPPESAKTAITIELLIALAVGGVFAGQFKVNRPCRVVYCTNEGKYGFSARLRAALAYNGESAESVRGKIVTLFDMPQLFDATSERRLEVFANEWIRAARGTLDLIVFDTLNKASLGGEESSNDDAAIACDNVAKLGDQLGCGSLFLHHSPHDSERPRGASAYIGDMDYILRSEYKKEQRAGSLHLFKGKDIDRFIPLGYKLVPSVTSIAVAWGLGANSDAVFARIAAEMRAKPGKQWWTIKDLAEALPAAYDAVRKALDREMEKGDKSIIERSDREGRGAVYCVRNYFTRNTGQPTGHDRTGFEEDRTR